MTDLPELWRPMKTAPRDGTIVRLLVDYRGKDACHPLEDAPITHTVGGNTDGNTGLKEGWKFAGWSWEQDCFCEGRGKPVGWLPLAPAACSGNPCVCGKHGIAGVPACPAGVPVFRMELAAGDLYELRQLDDFGSLPEGEYVLHAVPADGVTVDRHQTFRTKDADALPHGLRG